MGRRIKLRVELIGEDEEPQVILRCHAGDERLSRLVPAMESILGEDSEMVLTLGDTEYYVKKQDILFFETLDGKISAHTREHMYYTTRRLTELEAILGPGFVRVSKSCILNAHRVSALSHSLTGTGQVAFYGTDKIAYVSRGYFKQLKDKIHELRCSEE